VDFVTKIVIDAQLRLKALTDRDESGQGMIEYGLLVALISVVAIGVITAIGTGLVGNFQSVENAL
jgi:pilus assembly protein Flp/PilA